MASNTTYFIPFTRAYNAIEYCAEHSICLETRAHCSGGRNVMFMVHAILAVSMGGFVGGVLCSTGMLSQSS